MTTLQEKIAPPLDPSLPDDRQKLGFQLNELFQRTLDTLVNAQRPTADIAAEFDADAAPIFQQFEAIRQRGVAARNFNPMTKVRSIDNHLERYPNIPGSLASGVRSTGQTLTYEDGSTQFKPMRPEEAIDVVGGQPAAPSQHAKLLRELHERGVVDTETAEAMAPQTNPNTAGSFTAPNGHVWRVDEAGGELQQFQSGVTYPTTYTRDEAKIAWPILQRYAEHGRLPLSMGEELADRVAPPMMSDTTLTPVTDVSTLKPKGFTGVQSTYSKGGG